jgi:hypothetical protein
MVAQTQAKLSAMYTRNYRNKRYKNAIKLTFSGSKRECSLSYAWEGDSRVWSKRGGMKEHDTDMQARNTVWMHSVVA